MIDRSRLRSDYAMKQSREKYKAELDNRIDNLFQRRINSENEETLQSLFRDVGLVFYRTEKIDSLIVRSIEHSKNSSLSFRRSLVETIIILYPNEHNDYVKEVWTKTSDPTLYSYCSHHLLDKSKVSEEQVRSKIKSRFPNWENIPQLKFMKYYLENSDAKIPDLKELLSHDFMKGKTLIYSIHRKNRSFAGLTLIKGPDGSFLGSKDDSIFYVKQLAKSVSSLPGYLSQGDTPQGIFSVVGFYVSPTESIGPTANVLTRIPFEVTTKLFYHGTVSNKSFLEKDYRNLLPDSWKYYLPMFEAFYAGKTGRRKIVMHGSVDDLNFYKDEIYYPLTPSKGCLTTKEIWSEVDGKNIESDQSKLMNAFFSTGQIKGFLVVVNIDDKKQDVQIEEILPYLE